MAQQLCKSHVTVLRKVARQLAYKQKMDSTQLILAEKNRSRIEKAEQLLYKAINILEQIK